MSVFQNPLYAATLPPANPTGSGISNPNDIVPSGNPYNPITTTSPNSPSGIAPTTFSSGFQANTGPYSSTGGSVPVVGSTTDSNPTLTGAPSAPGGINAGDANMFGFNLLPADQQAQMLHTLNDTYGPGVGSALFNFLKSGAGFNQDVMNSYVQNVLAQLQPGINQGEENLMSQFSASGNRFGSGAELGLGNYLSQVNLNEGEIISQAEMQMYEQSLQDYMGVLTGASSGTAAYMAAQPNAWDIVTSLLGLKPNTPGSTSSGGGNTAGSLASGVYSAVTGPGAGIAALLGAI